jgi:hypothetical protein
MENLEVNNPELENEHDADVTEDENQGDGSNDDESEVQQPRQQESNYLVQQKQRYKREAENYKQRWLESQREIESIRQGYGARNQNQGQEPSSDEDVKSYVKSIFRETQQEEEARQRQYRIQQEFERFESDLDGMTAKIPDYEEVVAPLKRINTVMTGAQLSPQGGKEVLYHLGKKHEELDRIMRLPEPAQVKAVIDLAMRVARVGKQPSKAPEPPKTPVKGIRAGANNEAILKQFKDEIRKKYGR